MRIDSIEYELRQRAYDGKWENLARVKDHENAYVYKTDSGQNITLTPDKWICIGVHDLLVELE